MIRSREGDVKQIFDIFILDFGTRIRFRIFLMLGVARVMCCVSIATSISYQHGFLFRGVPDAIIMP